MRLPDDAPRPARGAVVRVAGKLADPYGQLELRPAASGIAVVGGRGLPDPLPIAAAALGEGTEGRLVVLEGTLDRPIVRESNGDVVLALVDAAGTAVRARAVRAAGIEPTAARRGARLRLVGIVGQRASRKGALDGYRLWLRDAADLVVVAPAPASSPAPTPASTPRPGDAPTPVEPIAAILRRTSGTVTVEGVVTTPATLLDASARRILVQDRSGAVEVLVPAGATAPGQGSRVRVTGERGTAYGAPRIRASAVAALGRGESPGSATARRRAPRGATKGELVRVEADVIDVQRLGDRWRAEVRTAGKVVVVAGLAGAAIPAATLVEGGHAIVTGVVRRPHPAAVDRRFAVVPRSTADIRMTGPGTGASPSGGPAGGPGPAATGPAGAAGAGGSDDGGVTDADLADLGGRIGRTVRVGGLVVATAEASVFIDDGTATGELRLLGEATALVTLLEPGDAVSATGRVAAGTAGGNGATVEVADPSRRRAARRSRRGAPVSRSRSRPSGSRGRTAAAPGPPPIRRPGVPASLPARIGPRAPAWPAPVLGTALVLLLALPAATIAVRRRRDRRRLAARIAGRLAGLASPPPAPVPAGFVAPIATEHGASVRDPA